MKAQRRHELKENDLAHALDVGRRYLDEHGQRVGMAVVVIVAVVAVTALTVRSQTAATGDRWQRMSELSFDDPEIGRESLSALALLTEQTTDEQFVLWSLIKQGEKSLRLALKVPAPPDHELNERARRAFDELLNRVADNPLAFGVAHLGLATVAENAFVIDAEASHKEAARRHLGAVIDNPALDTMPFKRMAMDRMASLDATFTRIVFDEVLPEEAEPADADPADSP